MAKTEGGIFAKVREKIAKEAKGQGEVDAKELEEIKAKEEVDSKHLNPEWDEQEKKLMVLTAEAPPELLVPMSLAMVVQSKMGKTSHMRNGARRVLLSIMERMQSHEAFKGAEEMAKKAGKGDYNKARQSLLDDFELEDGKDVRPS